MSLSSEGGGRSHWSSLHQPGGSGGQSYIDLPQFADQYAKLTALYNRTKAAREQAEARAAAARVEAAGGKVPGVKDGATQVQEATAQSADDTYLAGLIVRERQAAGLLSAMRRAHSNYLHTHQLAADSFKALTNQLTSLKTPGHGQGHTIDPS